MVRFFSAIVSISQKACNRGLSACCFVRYLIQTTKIYYYRVDFGLLISI